MKYFNQCIKLSEICKFHNQVSEFNLKNTFIIIIIIYSRFSY